MFHEDSFHRQLWNEVVACAPGLAPEVRQGRFVPAAGACAPELAGDTRQQEVVDLRWKRAAMPYVAHTLPLVAATLRRARHQTDRLRPDLPEEFRPGCQRLSCALHGLGPAFVPVAEAAATLALGSVPHGTGVADLATRAARLPYEDRLRCASALCDTCPEALLPFLPPCLLPPFIRTSGPPAPSSAGAARAPRLWHRLRHPMRRRVLCGR